MARTAGGPADDPSAGSRPDFGSPVGILSIAVVVNMVVLIGLGVALSQSAELLVEAEERTIHLVELRGEIALYDEVLTMSARMAAASGDPSWEARYHHFEPILGEAIDEAARLVPTEASTGAALTDVANQALIAMELQAFDLVRAKRPDQAAALMASPEYERQKQAYSEGLAAYMDQVEAELFRLVERQQRRSRSARLAALFGAGFLLVGWGVVLRRIARWRAQVAQAERQVRQTLATLEERVEERTQELSRSHEELRSLTQALMVAEEAERGRLALVLHDDLQQLLVSALFRLGAHEPQDPTAREDIEAATTAIHRAVDQSRSLASELGAPRVDGTPAEVLTDVVNRMGSRHGLTIHLRCNPHLSLDPTLLRFVCRATRELLFNVVKHADTEEAWLDVEHVDGELVLELRDQGAGFPTGDDPAVRTGLGLPALKRRADWLGGQLVVTGRAAGGTVARLTLPCGSTQSPPHR